MALSAARAQDNKFKKFNLAFKTGLSVYVEDPQLLTLQAGIQGEYRFNKRFSVHLPIVYNHWVYIYDGIEGETGFIQFMAGPRIYANNGFFGGIALGYSVHPQFNYFSDGGFTFQPHIGYDLPNVQFTLSYTGLQEYSMLSFVDLGVAIKLFSK